MAARAVFVNGDKWAASSWKDVERAIGLLDGGPRTDVFIGRPEGQRFMAISGGNDGNYKVVVQDGKRGYYTLLNPDNGEELVRVDVGGLEDYCPASRSHKLATVLKAAKTYYATGKKDKRFQWKKGA